MLDRSLPAIRRFGAGPPLLLVHGALATGAMFDPLVPFLSDRFDLIIPDLRGQGASGDLPPPYTVERHAADLAALIEGLGIERLSVTPRAVCSPSNWRASAVT